MRSFPKSRLYIRSTVKTFISETSPTVISRAQNIQSITIHLIREIDDITFPMVFSVSSYSRNRQELEDLSVSLIKRKYPHNNIWFLPQTLCLSSFTGSVSWTGNRTVQSLFGISFHKYGTQRIIRQIAILDGQQTVQIISQSHPCDITMRSA